MKRLMILVLVIVVAGAADVGAGTLSLEIYVDGVPYGGEELAVGTTVDVWVVQDAPNLAGSGGEITVTMSASGGSATDTTPQCGFPSNEPFCWDWLVNFGTDFIDNGDGTWSAWMGKVASLSGTPGIGICLPIFPFTCYESTIAFSFEVTETTELVWGWTWDGVNMDGVVGGTVNVECVTYYVDGVNGNDANDGLSRETAFATIQKGIDTAVNDDEVIVADGTYTGDGNRDIDFLGKAITVKSQNGPENCIIDCNNEAIGFFFQNAEQNNSVLDGLTITKAANYDPHYLETGAVYCGGSSPKIKNCIITRNYMNRGIYCYQSNAVIKNCTISYNSYSIYIDHNGSGIYCNQSSPSIDGCTISYNKVSGLGGGIYCERSSSPVVTNCTINANITGGGIFCDGSNPIIINSTIIQNKGGGVTVESISPVIITNSIIRNNSISQIAGPVIATYSNIQGGWDGQGNINIDPLLTCDGHLQAASPCINAGDPCYVPAPDETDIDGESRIIDGGLDMGYDEFADSDSDGLPDWWELKYFADPNIADPADDPDSDQWPNIDEYINSTEPNVIPVVYFVMSYNNAGSSPTQSLDSQYIPKDNIQEAVWACRMRHNDIVMLAPGTYTGYYNTNIDFYGKAITISSTDPQDPCVVAATIIDCQHNYNTRAFSLHSSEGPASLITGLTITNGNASKEPSPPYSDPIISKGGAISCDIASPTIKNCFLTANNAQVEGGALYCYNAAPKISDCIISDNSSMYGGAIYCLESSPEITDCDINYNSAKFYGGAVYSEQSCLTVLNSIIMQNSADDGAGGGIYYKDSNSVITNCIISGNSSKIGGAIFCWDSSPILDNCTIIGNLAFGKLGDLYSGGAILCVVGGNPILTNCILWYNAPEQVCLASTGIPTITYSSIQDGWTGQGNIDLHPSFVDPGFWDTNDTPADANDDLWIEGDYHLKSEGWRWDKHWTHGTYWKCDFVTSRCIDAGNPGSPLGEELLTIPDDPDHYWGENLRINMGAYGGTAEASMPPYCWALLGDLSNDGTINYADLAGQVSDWLTIASEQPGDLNRDGIVNGADFALLAQDWLLMTAWAP